MKSGNLQEGFAGVVARVESLRGRMGESRGRWRGCLRVCWRRLFMDKLAIINSQNYIPCVWL